VITTEAAIRALVESDLRTQVIMPLMNAMGYRGVHEWHAAVEELGKDIVGWKEDEFGTRTNVAVVAKAARVSGTTVHEVARQVQQCFNAPFQDPITHETMNIHTVWVITNKEIPTDSMPGFWSQIHQDRQRHVRLIDGEELWKRWKEYFPIATHQSIKEAQERISAIDTPYKVEVTISPGEERVTIGESYPGQLEAEPLEVKGRFEVPNTPEGRQIMEDIDAMFSRGVAADIPPGVLNVEFPEPVRHIYQQVFGELPQGPMGFRMSSIPGRMTFPIRIDIDGDDGVHVDFPFIELRSTQSGTDEVTLTNDHQAYPIRVTKVVNFRDKTFELKFDRKDEPIAANLLHQLLLALKTLAKPCRVRVTSAENGVVLADRQVTALGRQTFDDHYFDFVAVMVLVQRKTGVPILLPRRDRTEEEQEVSGLLWWISKDFGVLKPWTHFTITSYGKAGDEKLILDQYRDIEDKILRIEKVGTSVSLFGSEIPLGRVRTRIPNPRIVNEEDVRRILAAAEEEVFVRIQLAPTQSDIALVEFLDWEDPDQPIRLPTPE
jgi:hypothetical protein